mmetsp:Transcript_31588/g.91364  ORF Transcript_31588/g.91364 Transcript_31588/m.91364 type:complete len:327 (+) Transcript_31588:75-1055(+)
MGGGASAATFGLRPGSGAIGSQSSVNLTATGSTTVVDVVEGGVQWLANVLDREKQEKEWLAHRYEERCKECRDLQQELSALRAELTETRRTAAVQMAVASTSPSNAAASGQKPLNLAAGPASSGTGSAGLMGRRGLALSIGTGPDGSGRPHKNSVGPVDVLSSLKENDHHHAGAVKAAVVPVAEAPSAAPAEDPWHDEPMSALLKRRTRTGELDASSAGLAPVSSSTSRPTALLAVRIEAPVTKLPEALPEDMAVELSHKSATVLWDEVRAQLSVPKGGDRKDLRVKAEKAMNLEDCPASPKRVVRHTKSARDVMSFPGGGSGGTQ